MELFKNDIRRDKWLKLKKILKERPLSQKTFPRKTWKNALLLDVLSTAATSLKLF
jgi:hypothetical protein